MSAWNPASQIEKFSNIEVDGLATRPTWLIKKGSSESIGTAFMYRVTKFTAVTDAT